MNTEEYPMMTGYLDWSGTTNDRGRKETATEGISESLLSETQNKDKGLLQGLLQRTQEEKLIYSKTRIPEEYRRRYNNTALQEQKEIAFKETD